MAVAGVLDYIINSVWKGGAGVKQAKVGIDGLSKTSKDAALQQHLLRQKTREFGRAVSRMAANVRSGKISLEEAEKQTAALRKEMGIAERQTRKSGVRFTEMKSQLDLVTAGLQAAGQVVGEFYDDLKEGADILATQEKFDALSASMGISSEIMMGELQEATQGMVSNATLVANAAELMNLGLTKSREETVRLSAVAGQLNWDMQVLGLTIANQSVARLDSLGLAIEDVKPRAAELAAAGASVSEAFKWAIIEAGEAKIEILGNSADTLAGKIQRLEVVQENINNRYKEFIAIRWEPILTGLVGTMDALTESTDKGGSSWRDFIVILNEVNVALGGSAAAGQEVIEAIDMQVAGIERYNKAIITVGRAEGDFVKASKRNMGLAVAAAEEAATARGNALTAYTDELATSIALERQINKESISGTLSKQEAIEEWTLSLKRTINAEEDYIRVARASVDVSDKVDLGLRLKTEQTDLATEKTLLAAEAQLVLNRETVVFFNQIGENSELYEQYLVILGLSEEKLEETRLSTELLNEQLFRQLEAHTGNVAAVALAGEALGIYTEKEADAMLKSALLEEAIRKQAEAWDGTTKGLEAIQISLQGYIDTLNGLPSKVETEIVTKYTTKGTPAASVGGHSAPAIPASHGGEVRGGIPGRDSVLALLTPGERVLTVAQNQDFNSRDKGGLSITVNMYGDATPDTPNELSQAVLASARKLGIYPQ